MKNTIKKNFSQYYAWYKKKIHSSLCILAAILLHKWDFMSYGHRRYKWRDTLM